MAIVIIPCLLDDVTCTHQQAGNHFISCWHLPKMSDIEIWLLYKITSDIPSFFYSDQTATFGNSKIKRVHVCCQETEIQIRVRYAIRVNYIYCQNRTEVLFGINAPANYVTSVIFLQRNKSQHSQRRRFHYQYTQCVNYRLNKDNSQITGKKSKNIRDVF